MENKDFVIENGVLKKYNGNAAHVVIPNDITSIGGYAFCGCTSLTSIEIPNSVLDIGECAFVGCVNLTSIKIPSSVIQIDEKSFYGCINLQNVTIPNSVITIREAAFKWIKQVKPQYNANGSLRAFKAFNSQWSCYGGFRYKVGEQYHQNGKIKCCAKGFHACPNPLSVFNYYGGDLRRLHFAEVELSGEISFAVICDKVAASDIKIVRELTVQELCDIYNKMKKEK